MMMIEVWVLLLQPGAKVGVKIFCAFSSQQQILRPSQTLSFFEIMLQTNYLKLQN